MTTLSLTDWMKGQSPSYNTNTDRNYAYSEVPYIGDYYLVKLPTAASYLIYHVDYWGEGRIETEHSITGFTDCYNVNHPFKLVSNGTNKGRKIPNRIPVESFTNCDTSSYIKDDSVILVTVVRATINSSCAADIARMVHPSVGKVIVYGIDSNSPDIANLAKELKKKAMYHCPGCKLPHIPQTISPQDNLMVFSNITVIKDELVSLVETAAYDNAVILTKSLNNERSGDVIRNVIQKLYDNNSKNIIMYAYKLWKGEAQDIVQKYFTDSFKFIFSSENVTIVNNEYQQALELDATIDDEERLGWAVTNNKNSPRVTWKFIPVSSGSSIDESTSKLAFKILNVDSDMYLKFDTVANDEGDRKVFGKKVSVSDAETYYLEPSMDNGTVSFYILHSLYNQYLKVPDFAEASGNRSLWGHNSNTSLRQKVLGFQSRFKWTISSKAK